MPPQDTIETKLAIQALKNEQKGNRKVLDKVSDSLHELINMQKSHEIFHEKVMGKFDVQKSENKTLKEENMRLNTRVLKVETNQTRVVWLIVTFVIVKALSLL